MRNGAWMRSCERGVIVALVALWGSSPVATFAQDTPPNESPDASPGAETTPAPAPPSLSRVGPWRVVEADASETGRVVARAILAHRVFTLSSKTWSHEGARMTFRGRARLVSSDWVLRAEELAIEERADGTWHVKTLDRDGERAPTFIRESGKVLSAKEIRVALEADTVSFEAPGMERRLPEQGVALD